MENFVCHQWLHGYLEGQFVYLAHQHQRSVVGILVGIQEPRFVCHQCRYPLDLKEEMIREVEQEKEAMVQLAEQDQSHHQWNFFPFWSFLGWF